MTATARGIRRSGPGPTRERYAYRFAAQQVVLERRPLACGDYGVTVGGQLVAAVERKSLPDLVSSLLDSTRRYAVAELAACRERRSWSRTVTRRVFKVKWARPSVVADALAELQLRWPNVALVFTENRQLAEEWTCRYLGGTALGRHRSCCRRARTEHDVAVGRGHDP